MVRRMEEQKEALKRQMNEAIDEYCDKFSQGSEKGSFTINKIEALMMENQRKLNEILEEANSGFVSEIETDNKKMSRVRVSSKANQKR